LFGAGFDLLKMAGAGFDFDVCWHQVDEPF
jgi:hypothetical protein